MSVFSLCIKAIFLIVLVFPYYCETALDPNYEIRPWKPNCEQYPPGHKDCTREWDPICASNGNTYGNPCAFCTEKRKSGEKFTFLHFGAC